ncbi:MAG: CPBP family intramembrane metalloprotease [Phaeodactylibacter sp.]|nr:CPBP family intramembrane metalloprotease [Phaeodactylibacter sp.]MCB9300570.1 CPBP family intramembrane metalloprotease [Lewinellaceae bacterium]
MIPSELLSSILQILVFTLIPFLVFVIRTRSAKGFFDYIGLKPLPTRAVVWAIVSSLIFLSMVALAFIRTDFWEALTAPESITGKFRAMGFSPQAMILVLIMALLKTSLSEEILFRGFLAKRLISWLGFQAGNILQALVFGAIHLLLFLSITSSIFFLALIFLFTALGAYTIVYINEKMAGGSIIPGWISHGLANVISYSVIGFLT